ncbi:lysophospholipase [Flammeovirga yaeyamensis]|uniref:Lysophospholipase n=1 Tax=Flammeovirga yaeyamensis TaxID=367791 RepID=A0AAX1NB91_9BACT|nr:alpha/beta fold hydrolase [Flammeovirga yaeyamensis]MBB3701353.1 hypothetical protein [Flammeovirga yaeyamensis]NMF38579.1 alpha/beta hydrolase [Flammeovirga yaeyamensis]QWG04457.1 lysophospholipase [Flammeovirga yaeyamensis]
MKKLIKGFLLSIVTIYIIFCGGLYLNQESLIFFPDKLKADYQFEFPMDFEEMNFNTSDGNTINGLLFKSDSTKGLVFFLHGNSGSLENYGYTTQVFLENNYNVLMIDYRGFGKSTGEISSQKQLFDDNQMIYDRMKLQYNEENIIIMGYSIGTGMASFLASKNNPKELILQAPYYGLKAMMRKHYPYVPPFLLKYRFATYKYLRKCNFPIYIFHGKGDNVIPYDQSVKLKEEFPSKIELTTLKNQGHNGISNHSNYLEVMNVILSKE